LAIPTCMDQEKCDVLFRHEIGLPTDTMKLGGNVTSTV